jgi:hypothetical protein
MRKGIFPLLFKREREYECGRVSDLGLQRPVHWRRHFTWTRSMYVLPKEVRKEVCIKHKSYGWKSTGKINRTWETKIGNRDVHKK